MLLPLGMENAAPLGDKLGNVRFFFDRGVRYITLAHSANNRLADSSYALEKKWNGLSPFGRRGGARDEPARDHGRRVAPGRRLGPGSDRAEHGAGDRQPFRVPPLHAGFERNISDELARAIAAKGGVVQVPFGTAFIDPASAADTQAFFPRERRFRPPRRGN